MRCNSLAWVRKWCLDFCFYQPIFVTCLPSRQMLCSSVKGSQGWVMPGGWWWQRYLLEGSREHLSKKEEGPWGVCSGHLISSPLPVVWAGQSWMESPPPVLGVPWDMRLVKFWESVPHVWAQIRVFTLACNFMCTHKLAQSKHKSIAGAFRKMRYFNIANLPSL